MIEALYLHIPFCVSRCSYCDFATNACDDDARMDAYVDALSLQLRRASRAGLLAGIKTIYIGGGTPTHLGARRLNSLVYLISLSVNLENVEEFTIEANPESIDERMVKDLYALGVDRVSIGAQSFDARVLREYGRAHDVEDIERAVDAARARFDNISLDLICGGPGQSMDSWRDSVERAIDLGIEHVSIYPLMLEEGTPMTGRVEAGERSVASDDEQADMMLAAEELLTRAGMHRYEIASYALPGHESKHNAAYWKGIEYLGLGAGAASMLGTDSARKAFEARIFPCDGCEADASGSPYEIRTPDPRCARVRLTASADDIAFVGSGSMPEVEVEVLSEHEAQVEDLMLGMRMSAGVTGAEIDSVPGARAVFEDLVSKGLVLRIDDRFAPTQRGWLLGNEVFGAIWDLAGNDAQA